MNQTFKLRKECKQQNLGSKKIGLARCVNALNDDNNQAYIKTYTRLYHLILKSVASN